MNIIIIGLSLSSSMENSHATTYRSLIKGLYEESHQVTFLEQDVSGHAGNRDLPSPPYCERHLYENPGIMKYDYDERISDADLVIIGSDALHSIDIGKWVTDHARGITAFYDLDTPVTLTRLDRENYESITPALIPEYDLYLSSGGGKALALLTETYRAKRARPLYCSVDPELCYPEDHPKRWQIGYPGIYSAARQPGLDSLLLETARRQPDDCFVVAGSRYPSDIMWPANVERIGHVPPDELREFYNRQRFTLNITGRAVEEAGISPASRLFEAAACATPVISDYRQGLETLFEPDKEILIARTTEDVQHYLADISEEERKQIGGRARERVLNEHTSRVRARQLVQYVQELKGVAV